MQKRLATLATLACVLLVACYAHVLLKQHGRAGGWLVDDKGVAQLTDYVSLWAAGHMARDGRAAAAYDWDAHAVVMSDVLQREQGPFPFSYPPTYLAVMSAAAALPYVPSMLLMGLLTLGAYAAVGAGIVGNWRGAAWIAAPLGTLLCFYAGQNGFLTAALLGGGLLFLPTRPILAGVLVGLLTIKPHLGLMVPLALAAAGCWRAFGAAAATAIAMALVSALLLGADTWGAFVDSLARFGTKAAASDYVIPAKLQSAFGMPVSMGLPRPAAMTMHVALALAIAASVWTVWRRDVPYALKAALLAAASLLASPYVFIYDLTMHGIVLAFMLRHWLDTRLEPMSLVLLVTATTLCSLYYTTGLPMGFVASLAVLGLVLRECREHLAGRTTTQGRLPITATA